MTTPGLSSTRLRNAENLIQRYVGDGILPGAVTLVARKGEIVYLKAQGWHDIENKVPMREDALFRIYSMTKIVTSVAIMLLYEKGLLDLNDSLPKFFPAFANLQVKQADGSLVPAARDVTIYDLLRHCGGISYSVEYDQVKASHTLETLPDAVATEPLVEQPGVKWMYSNVSTDMLARLVEIVSGRPFDVYLQENIFAPLGMRDAGFFVADDKADRLATSYVYDAEKNLVIFDGSGPESRFRSKPKYLSGAGGLVCSTDDYYRFASMLLNGGRFGNVVLLGRKTVELMTFDHLPREHDNLRIGTQCFRFGLGVSVMTDVAASRCLSSLGEFGWGGALGTQVWINPQEEMLAMIMIQVRSDIPTGIMDIYKRMVYQALV
jgi:CubicO group peptidase (beta-lactamase class C family)